MRRALAVALALCCVLAPVALAAPGSSDDGRVGVAAPVAPPLNTTASLGIVPGAVESADYRRATLDVAGTLALDARVLEGQFRQAVLDRRFSTTDATTARRDQLTATATRIEARIARLRDRQADTIADYNNGTVSGQAFLRELARIATAADRLRTAVERVEARASDVPLSIDGSSVRNWAMNRRIALDPFVGPVRERIAATLRGENTVQIDRSPSSGISAGDSTRDGRLEPLWTYVETTHSGVVVATVDAGEYYREAYVPAERNVTGEAAAADVSDRLATLYPWATNNSGTRSQRNVRRAGISRFTFGYGHGRLTTYFDRRSGTVFAEHQRKRLARLPTAAPVTATTGEYRLAVNRTSPTGPITISLASGQGTPLDGAVAVANRSFGRTGSDGRLWTIAPRGNVTIAARANGSTVRLETNATVEPNRTAPVTASEG